MKVDIHVQFETGADAGHQGANYKKILRLSYDVIITYDYRKLLSHRKIVLRFFVISPQGRF